MAYTTGTMSENRSILYKIRWEILVIAASLILSAVVMVTIPNNFSAQIIQQQKMQRQAEEEKALHATPQEQIGLAASSSTNITAANSTGTKP